MIEDEDSGPLVIFKKEKPDHLLSEKVQRELKFKSASFGTLALTEFTSGGTGRWMNSAITSRNGGSPLFAWVPMLLRK